jgi:L-alanine-DL-glutamate epimerase-like enolase superfamily enzyme
VVELEEVVRGMDALAHEAVWSKLLDLTLPHVVEGNSEAIRPRYGEGKRIQVMAALGGIDIALWDIKGKALDLPLWRLLGGDRREVPAYASGGYYEEGYSPLAVIDEMASYVERGYRAVKMKCGGLDLRGDIERISGVRKAIGDASLMLDANGAYNLRDAEQAIRSFEPYDIFWFEEPLHWYDATRGLARLAASTKVPLASGESELHSWAVRDLIDLAGIRYVQFDCTRAGGITEWLRVAAYASAHGVLMAPHHDPQIHGHLVAAAENGYVLELFPNETRDPVWAGLFSSKPDVRRGTVTLPARPGLGIELDRDFIAHHTTNA